MRKLLLSAMMGVVIGVLTLIGQRYLPIQLNFLANSGAIWLIPASVAASSIRDNAKSSILAAIFCLLGCVYGYYVFESLYNQHPFSFNGGVIIWSVTALFAGGIFGLGAYCANSKDGLLKYCCMNMLPAVFMAEGLDEVFHISDYMHMVPAVIMKIVIGVILYIAINRAHLFELKSIASFISLSVLGLCGYIVLSSRILA